MRIWSLIGTTALFLVLPGPALAEVVSNGEWWFAMAPAQRYSYLDGYLDGRTLGVSALAARLGPPADAQAKALLQRLPGLVDRRALERQIDRVYREPLNVYLSLDEAAFIAGEQIKGRPVEAELQRLRPDAYERYRILRQLDKH